MSTRKNEIAVSTNFGVLPNIRRGGNNARVWEKIASPAAIIGHVLWCFCDEPFY